MKYAITGHTSGIGRAFCNSQDVKENYIGFSRSNGYDISNAKDRKQIIAESADCDVFINNAYCLHYQTDLLYELYKVWHKSTKIIINIGSDATDRINEQPFPYAIHKSALEAASLQLGNTGSQCKVSLIKFGWVGTKKILRDVNPKKFITVSKSADIILQIIELNKIHNVRVITVLP